MKIAFRWFGDNHDSVGLEQIRQLPYVRDVISTLYDKPAGEVWERSEIRALRDKVEAYGLSLSGIESLNVSESIKAGFKDRDEHIEAYMRSLANLGEEGIDLVIYNFMPLFDWVRTSLSALREDGSVVLGYDDDVVKRLSPDELFSHVSRQTNGFELPGWERYKRLKVPLLAEYYSSCSREDIFSNLIYFLDAVLPVCEMYGIRLAVHPDDPPWDVYGIPRVLSSIDDFYALFDRCPSVCNGLTLCTGSIGVNPSNDVLGYIRELGERVFFVHVRNFRLLGERKFEECSHVSCDGHLDMLEIFTALRRAGFDGIMRPDHGRAIWGERGMPGYGLFDQALGAAYMHGLWEGVSAFL